MTEIKSLIPTNIKYIGKVKVRINGIRGDIQPGRILHIPEEMANNLLLDKDNWQRLTPVNTNTIADNTLPDELLAPLEDSPGGRKEEKEKGKGQRRESKGGK